MSLLNNVQVNRRWFVLAVLILVLVLGSGCSAMNSGSLTHKRPNSELNEYWLAVDLFSGRSNPSRQLAAETANELRQRVKALKRADAVAIPDHLGYRGILLYQDDEILIRFYDGIVYLTEVGATTYYHDPEREFEKEIIQELQSALDTRLYDKLLSEISGN